MYRIFGPRGRLIVRAATAARVRRILPGLRRRFGQVKVVLLPAPKPKRGPFVMYDSVTVSQIPSNAQAVAGYVGGNWPTFAQLEHDFPNARRLSIAVNAGEDADCLDVERGDAVPAEAPAWVQRQIRRGVKRPCVYSSVSEYPKVLAALKAHGIPRRRIRIVTAHYTGKPHRCGPLCSFGFWARADATQYTNRALGRNLDASYCSPDFLP